MAAELGGLSYHGDVAALLCFRLVGKNLGEGPNEVRKPGMNRCAAMKWAAVPEEEPEPPPPGGSCTTTEAHALSGCVRARVADRPQPRPSPLSGADGSSGEVLASVVPAGAEGWLLLQGPSTGCSRGPQTPVWEWAELVHGSGSTGLVGAALKVGEEELLPPDVLRPPAASIWRWVSDFQGPPGDPHRSEGGSLLGLSLVSPE